MLRSASGRFGTNAAIFAFASVVRPRGERELMRLARAFEIKKPADRAASLARRPAMPMR